MQELSMNVLDIAENSVSAGATLISISLAMSNARNELVLIIEDNGCGMGEDTLAKVTDPFCTSRKTRKVGLGLPFLKMAAEQTGGKMHITSVVGKGTRVCAEFTLRHIDLAPIGAIGQTVAALIQCNPTIDFVFTASNDSETFCANTRELRKILGEVSFAEPEIAIWLRDYLEENTKEILKRSIVL
ncbi:MAG: ATP-binding protein [Oscillospiraceae bacterium]